ncbi:hypothetical protein [Polyangium jinanense]|uniref:Secreted protein n=1 Tax=Polyangium jinanense TaxID=2829994 RepID=A0A9X4AZZ5_9BACT|nr:hypothetical protein [Polyangium jinanense]MDC3962171.1 hypothetical protein [Polyangium jinanense]MDC3988880.1 hypothetical protein [Polyangium jinanense]
MKLRSLLPAIAALSLLSSVASPEDAPDASPGDAGADAAAAAPTESLPFLGPVPAEKSKPPTFAEWTAAKDLDAPVSSTFCGVRRVREWLRFRCEVMNSNSIDLVTGNSNDAFFSVKQGGGECTSDPDQGQICWDAVEVVFPLRRGDRRFFQITQRTGGGYYVPGSGPMVRSILGLSEMWVEDEPGPIVTIVSW